MPAYAELAVTTNFSFLRGASHPEELAMQASALGLAGIGVADRNSVAGVVRAHEAAKEHGVRLAVGARLVFADGAPDILAYPQDRAGWTRLVRLLTRGKRCAEKGACTLFLDDLLSDAAGLNLIVLAGETTSTPPRDVLSLPPPLRGRPDRAAIREGGNCAGPGSLHSPPRPSPSSGEGAACHGATRL
jgi:error-prone DNA polymerase